MRIGLTFNLKPAGATGDRFEEFDSEETIRALEGALRAHGHDPVRLGWGEEMLDTLDRERVDGVFNLAEGIGGRGRESQVPAVLEMYGVPCTASSALSIGLTLDKALAKMVAAAHGIATSPFRVVGGGSWVVGALRFPLFCKPGNEGSSMGITSSSFCRDEAELNRAIERLSEYGPVLVEEFLPGDEFTVGIIDGEPIGVMQVLPRAKEENFIYSLEVKRDYLKRVEYRMFRNNEIEAVALAVWRAFGLRDVARVDIRRDRDGVANFVEVNPLPGMNPVTSDLIILAAGLGWKYDDLIGRVVDSAIRRWNGCAS
ncbi:MAG TPA: D-alanine--D-alanine ligase [Thermoanaerobaculia bacterium]|nr:D-alanine--D-alanine ligase [Thermoanaerobaculia bacterium]